MRGNPLHTIQQYMRKEVPDVSIAMARNAFPYGQKLSIRELDQVYGQKIVFRVVDTGGAFVNRGRSRIDICSENKSTSLDPVLNKVLTVQPIGEG